MTINVWREACALIDSECKDVKALNWALNADCSMRSKTRDLLQPHQRGPGVR